MIGTLKNVVIYSDPNSQTAEAIRCLRTNIQFLNAGEKIKVITLTSGLPQEGKSFLSANLAVATAQANKKTLLIDCDLRRAGVSKALELNIRTGLSDFLSKKDVSMKDVPIYDVGIENLAVLPCGSPPATPAELLESKGMDDILSMARENFDVVYIDAPPVLSVADPVITGKKSDGVIFIVKANSSLTNLVKRSCNILNKAEVRILGMVFNSLDLGVSGYYRYKYRYYYKKRQ